jgi:hypothetical protein
MRSVRIQESVMLGYSIERVQDYDAIGLLHETRYEVFCADSGAVIGNTETLRSAQNLILTYELEIAAQRRRAA